MSLRRSLFAALSAASLLSVAATAAVAGPWSLAPGEYYTELRGGFHSASSYYNDDGDRVLTNTLSESRSLRSYIELGWKKSLSVQMTLPAVSRTFRNSNTGATQSNAGLGDFGFGMRWALQNGASATAVQFAWQAPAGYNREITPALGDGNQKLSASLAMGRPAGKNAFWQASAGYLYDFRSVGARSKDLAADGDAAIDWADHFTADATVGVWMGDLLVAGQWLGEFPSQTGRATETTWMLAGPRLTYRVDDRIDAFAGSWHTPTGKNVMHIDEFYAGVTWKATKLNRLQGFLGSAKRP
jgi:hypothetical protein